MTICEADILDAYGAFTEVLVTPTDDSDNGVVVKVPNSTWGVDQPYGSGQAFMLVREGDRADTGPDGAVLARMDRHGSLGINALHAATGFRSSDPDVDTGVWLDPSDDVVPLFINNPHPDENPSTRDFLVVWDQRDGSLPLVVTNYGSVMSGKEVVARSNGSALKAFIGNVYGSAGLGMGSGGGDTAVTRKAAGVVSILNAAFFPKVLTEPAAQSNGMVAFCIANAQGKLQAKIRFPTGASVVVATEP